MSVTTAVVGAGVVSDTHLSADAANPRADLVAVCDLDEERAERAAGAYDITAYTDVKAMLSSEDPDLVHICTPVQTHLPLAQTVIEAGVATVIEKPIAETVTEVEKLETLSADHGVPVTVVHQGLFSPAVREARETIAADSFGDVRAVELIKTGYEKPDEAHRGNWVFDLPGGEFEEGIPHSIYPVLGIGGYPQSEDQIEVVTSLVDEYQEYTYDNAQIQYVTDSGTLCSAMMTSGGSVEQLLHVQGENQSLTVDILTQTVTVSDGVGESAIGKVRRNVNVCFDRLVGTVKNATAVGKRSLNDDWETEKQTNSHAYQLDEVIRAVESGSQMPVPLSEAKWTIRIMEAIRTAGGETTAGTLAEQ